VRKLIGVLGLVAVLAGATACSDRSASANHSADEPPPSVAPAADAGGACQLIDYDSIKATLGVTFAVAGAAQQGDTYTCVTQARRASFPDLVLSVTATTADEGVFTSTVRPSGATAVTGLGKVAFSITFPASGKAGPAAEVGWLAGNARLLDLRLRLPANANADQATQTVPKLIELAKKIDLSSI
jgi:hypothetical protein